MRITAAESGGWIKVNETLSYEFLADSIGLHVPTVFTKKPTEMLNSFNEGLKTLARDIKNNPEFPSVKKIVGYSWIVYEHPNLLQKMGFSIDNVDEEHREARAIISIEDFLKRYGS